MIFNQARWLQRLMCGPVLGALMLLLALPQALHADTALEQLQTFIHDVETFQANFEQTLYDSDSDPIQVSTGSIKLKRPGRFIWTYQEPVVQQIIADGIRIWMYDEDLEQVTVNTMDERVAGTPLVLLMRSGPLEDAFDVKELGEAEGINWLEMIPKEDSSDFEAVFVGLNEVGLAAMELRDNFGQATQIIFTEFESGMKFDDALFQFTVPEGVDVIGIDER